MVAASPVPSARKSKSLPEAPGRLPLVSHSVAEPTPAVREAKTAAFALTTPTLKAAKQSSPRGCEPNGSGSPQGDFPRPGLLLVFSSVSSFCLPPKGDEIRNVITK